MLHKKWIAIALLSTAAVSTAASASDRNVNTALGAVAGALIGNSVGGRDAALVGGVLGAVVGASVSGGHDDRRYYGHQQAYRGQPVYYREPVRVRSYQRDGYGDRYYHDVRRVDYRR